MPSPMTPAMYTQNRLLCGGGGAFCAAVVVQLLQVTAFSTALWVALGAAAVEIPLLAAVLMAYAMHDRFTVRYDTEYIMPLLLLGLLATVACALAVFWHFAWWAGAGFLTISLVGFVLGHWDYTYHQQINPPTRNSPRLVGPHPNPPRAWPLSYFPGPQRHLFPCRSFQLA